MIERSGRPSASIASRFILLLVPICLASCEAIQRKASTKPPPRQLRDSLPSPWRAPGVDIASLAAFLTSWKVLVPQSLPDTSSPIDSLTDPPARNPLHFHSTTDTLPLHGAWLGTIGSTRIHACFEQDWRGSYSHGIYFELRRLELSGLGWSADEERWFDVSPDSARWVLERLSRDTAIGRWMSRKGETRAIRLTRLERLAGPGIESSSPCGSAEFTRPLEKRPPVRYDTLIRQDSFCLRRRSIRWRDQSRQRLEVCSEGPNNRRVNAILLKDFPRSDSGWQEFFGCTRSSLAGTGQIGYEHQSASPSFVSRQFLSMTVTGDGYCGGAHPWGLTNHQTVDLVAGREVDLWSWFAGLDTAQPELPEGLLSLIWSPAGCYSRSKDDDCSSDEQTTEFITRLDTNGMVFSPTPGGCCATVFGNDRIVPYRKLLPFLNAEGRRSVRAILAELGDRKLHR